MVPRLYAEVRPVEYAEDRKRVVPTENDQRSPRATGAWPDLAGVHVFLIEDNADTRTMVSEVLIHCGAMITVYQSADQVPPISGSSCRPYSSAISPCRGWTD